MSDAVLTPMQVYTIIMPWPGTPGLKYREWRRVYNHIPEVAMAWANDWDLSVWISANYDGPPIDVKTTE